MSKAFKCDITSDYSDTVMPSEKLIDQKTVNILGTVVDIELILKVDAFGGAKETHVSDTAWTEIMRKVKQYIEATYGV